MSMEMKRSSIWESGFRRDSKERNFVNLSHVPKAVLIAMGIPSDRIYNMTVEEMREYGSGYQKLLDEESSSARKKEEMLMSSEKREMELGSEGETFADWDIAARLRAISRKEVTSRVLGSKNEAITDGMEILDLGVESSFGKSRDVRAILRGIEFPFREVTPRVLLSKYFFPNPRNWSLSMPPPPPKDESFIQLPDDFMDEVPEYPLDHIQPCLAPGWAHKQETLSVTTFLGCSHLVTKHGLETVPATSLVGKQVLIACFFVPFLSFRAQPCRALIALSEELSKQGEDAFHIVIAVKMRSAWDNDKEAFNHFLSGFPDHFLAIPFECSKSRDHVAHSLALPPLNLAALLVDSHHCVSPMDIIFTLRRFGSAAFPFTPDHIRDINRQDVLLMRRLDSFSPQFKYSAVVAASHYCIPPTGAVEDSAPLSLAQFLNCAPEKHALLRIRGIHATETAPVSCLDGKLVALYLCFDGFLMKKVHDLHQQVKDHRPQLEVVLVPLSFTDDPSVFFQHVTLALHHHGISSWWGLTYNDHLCRTLWRISGGKEHDSLILLPFGDSYSGEIQAHAMIELFGSTVYPFTRQVLCSSRLSALSQVYFKSLLEDCTHLVSGINRTPVPLEHLHGKNILLCLAPLESSGGLSDTLLKHYRGIKSAHPDTVVAFLDTSASPDKKLVSEQPWLMLPSQVAESARKALFVENLGERSRWVALVSFGKDGRLCSREALALLLQQDYASVFKYNLPQEIAVHVAEELQDSVDMVM